MNARRRLAWLPLGLLGGLLLIAAGHLLGLFPAVETISPVRVHHTFPPSISSIPQALPYSFLVRNPSRQRVVHIREVKKSCGCLKTELGKTVLGPGESTTLKTVLDVSLSNDTRRAGIELHSDLREQPVWNYTLEADAYRPIVVVPERIAFGLVRPQRKLERSFEVELYRYASAQAPPELEVRCASTPLPVKQQGSSRLTPLSGGIERWNFSFELDFPSDRKPGQRREEILVQLKTDGTVNSLAAYGGKPVEAAIPITWEVQGPILAEPLRVFFGNVGDQSGKLVRRVTLRADDERAFRIVGLESSSPHVYAAIAKFPQTSSERTLASGQRWAPKEERSATQWEIEINLDTAFDSKFLSGMLSVVTDHMECPTVQINFSAFRYDHRMATSRPKEERLP